MKPDDIRLFTVGDARVETSRATITSGSNVAFATALYLILEHAKPVSRGALAALLWPNASVSASTHRLRQTLLKLRRLGLRVESVGKSLLTLKQNIWVEHEDLNALRSTIFNGSGSVFPFANFEPLLSDSFSEWLETRRAHVCAALAQIILEQLETHRRRGEWQTMERVSRQLLTLSPLNEEATLALAESLTMRGAKNEAVCTLDRYLDEIASGPQDIKVQASLMRRRIIDRLSPVSSLSVSDSPLVGRETAMMRLAARLQHSRSGLTTTVIVTGAAGIGKSRVLAELTRFAILQGFACVRIDCRPSHQSRPLSGFVELVPLLRALPGSIGCSPENLQFLDRLTRHDPSQEDKQETSVDPALILAGIQRALCDLIDAVADETPLLLQVEDIHWLDSTSADLLRDVIARTNQRVLFALTGRDITSTWDELPKQSTETVHLDSLDPKDSLTLLLSAAGESKSPMTRTYLEWCVRVAEGNPYFLIELARQWMETRVEHDVPPSLSSVLNERLSRLTRESLQLLQTCALLENNSTLERIEAVLGYETFELLASIDTLGAAGMVSIEAGDATFGERLLSKHELLSSAAVNRLSTPARRFLHRKIGQVLEEEIDDHFSAAILWDCAKHWQLAGDNPRAFHLATSCAAYLLKVGLPVESAEAYGRALNFCTSDSQRLEILRFQTTAYYRMSAWPDVLDSAWKVRQLEQRVKPDSPGHDEVELMELRAQWQTFDWYGCFQRTLRCVTSDTASSSHRAEAGVMALMLATYLCDSDTTKKVYRTIENLNSTGAVSRAAFLQAQMVFHTNEGDIKKAIRVAHELLELSAKGDVGALIRDTCNAAIVFRVAGNFEESERLFQEALEIARAHGLTLVEQRTILPYAHLVLELGRANEAELLYNRLLEIPINSQDNFTFIQTRALGVRLALCQGNAIEARHLLPFTLSEIVDDVVFSKRTYNLALLVAVHLAVDATVSGDAVRALEQSFVKSMKSPHQAFSAFVLYEALTRCGKAKRAAKILSEYEKTFRREPWPAPRHLLETLQRVSVSRK